MSARADSGGRLRRRHRLALKTADLDEFRRILRSMFVSFDLIPPTDEGYPVLGIPGRVDDEVQHAHDGPEAEVCEGDQRYWLMPRLRPEFVDDGWEVIRQPLPASAVTTDAQTYFCWYGAQDALRKRAPLHEALSLAFEEESAALV